MLWKDHGRQDVSVPLAGVKQVQVIRIDGSRRTLNAGGGSSALTVSEDPLLLLYEGGPEALPEALAASPVAIESAPQSVSRRVPTTLTVKLAGAEAGDVALIAPPFWTVEKSPAESSGKGGVAFKVAPPAKSEVHQADFTVTVGDAAGGRRGELYIRAPVAE